MALSSRGHNTVDTSTELDRAIRHHQPRTVDVVVLVVLVECMVALSLIDVMRQQCNRVEAGPAVPVDIAVHLKTNS
jgi:hypothetical protein